MNPSIPNAAPSQSVDRVAAIRAIMKRHPVIETVKPKVRDRGRPYQGNTRGTNTNYRFRGAK